jgi:TldD protein
MDYLETRQHELRKRRILMVDGALTQNLQSTDAGTSARVRQGGYWGFASAPDSGAAPVAAVSDQAARNAAAMGRFGPRDATPLSGGSHRGEHVFRGRPAISQRECVERLARLDAWCRQRYPDLRSLRFIASDEHHTKRVANSVGAEAVNSIQRALVYVVMSALDRDGAPVELMQPFSWKGSLADGDFSPEALGPALDELHSHMRAKCEAVAARGGHHTVVLAPALAGMLAHEAMGHPCEADLVIGGAVTGNLVGQRVASDLVTMVDVAHTWRGQEAMIPVYSDDEGTPATDAVLIRNGLLEGFMNSRETASRLGIAPTGNARAYLPSDEPLVRMRNTIIEPGASRLEDMIAGVDEGYFLMKTANGQADMTTEFMFGITLAYEIRHGKLGRAIKDTTVSGSAIKVLQTADAVSADMDWNCSGYCGKKQPMVVSMGGPALRVRAHVGGA